MAPRKKIVSKTTEPIVEITDTVPVVDTIDENVNTDEHILLQLPITESRLDKLIQEEHMHNILQYNPNIGEPTPYIPASSFTSLNDELMGDVTAPVPQEPIITTLPTIPNGMIPDLSMSVKKCASCYWCCHEVGHDMFGMPIRYDALSKNFTLYGTFCSLECASAYNFSVHLGSDRVWEIQSWIQMLAKRVGYLDPIRPAPSKYLLKMFDGPMTIEEFRKAHKNSSKTFLLNVPPLISVSAHMDVVNTSYMTTSSTQNPNMNPIISVMKSTIVKKTDKKKTIGAKMNLIIEEKTI